MFGNSYPKRGSDNEGGGGDVSCPSTVCSIVVDGPKKVGGEVFGKRPSWFRIVQKTNLMPLNL